MSGRDFLFLYIQSHRESRQTSLFDIGLLCRLLVGLLGCWIPPHEPHVSLRIVSGCKSLSSLCVVYWTETPASFTIPRLSEAEPSLREGSGPTRPTARIFRSGIHIRMIANPIEISSRLALHYSASLCTCDISGVPNITLWVRTSAES